MPSNNRNIRAISIGLVIIIISGIVLYNKWPGNQATDQEHATPSQVDVDAKKAETERQIKTQQQTLVLSDQIDSRKAEIKECMAIIGMQTMALPGYESRQADEKLPAAERQDARQKLQHANELIASTKKKKEQLEKQVAEMEKAK